MLLRIDGQRNKQVRRKNVQAKAQTDSVRMKEAKNKHTIFVHSVRGAHVKHAQSTITSSRIQLASIV